MVKLCIFVDNLLNAFVLKVSNKSCSQILTLSCYDFRNILSAECAVSCAATSVLSLLDIYKYRHLTLRYLYNNAILASELNREAQKAEDSVNKGTSINYFVRGSQK